MIDESVPVSESVIFIANILVIGVSVILHIGAPLIIILIIHSTNCLYIHPSYNNNCSNGIKYHVLIPYPY